MLINIVLLIIIFGDYWQQKQSGDRVWIAQQVSLIYDGEWEADSSGEKIYIPKASDRSREDAVKAYVAIEGDDARLARAVLELMAFSDEDFSGIDFTRARLRGANMTRADLRGSILVGADLRGAILRKAKLSRADMTSANAQGVNLSGADLKKATLERTTLGVCARSEVDAATGYEIVYNVTNGANCRGADFTGAVLKGASLCGADLSNAKGLDQRQLNQAQGDETTKLPSYVTRPRHWLGNKQRSPAKRENRGAAPPVQEEAQHFQ